jgi:Zn-finger nucleic acid-binding protein
MKCLSCSTGELVPTQVGDITIEKCTQCGGMWLERGELDRLRDEKDNDIRWMDVDLLHEAQKVTGKVSGRECPNGHGPTVTLNYGDTGLELDVCRVCGGIWLDPGEFDKMLAAMEEKAIATHASGYVRESLREAREVLAKGGLSSHEWKDLGAVLRMLRMRVGVEAPVIGAIIRALPR